MKKIFFLFLLFSSVSSYGQFTKDLYGVGLQTDFSTTLPQSGWDIEINNTNLKLLPSLQYWFNGNLSAALGVGYGYKTADTFGGNNYRGYSRSHDLPLLASLRYWHPIEYFNNRLVLYNELSPQLTLSWYKYEGSHQGTEEIITAYQKGYLTEVNLSAGLLLFVTEKIGLDVNIGGFYYRNQEWRSRWDNNSRGTEHHHFRFSLLPTQWKIGIHYLLNSKSVNLKEK